MRDYWKPDKKCPRLFLAPMEGLGDLYFRTAFTTVIGGYDEATTPFLRVPSNAHVTSLAKKYDPNELSPVPLAAQIMGGDAFLMAAMAVELEKRGAPRIDINVGCPSNTVVGRNAGSAILKTPELLFAIASAVVKAITIPVSVKMRTGFDDTSLFDDNLHAIEESGASFIIVHPRTKAEGYTPPAHWEYIARAKEIVSLPIVGNGDVITATDAINMWKMTQCDGIMVGRGALKNPWIFHDIRHAFSSASNPKSWDLSEQFIRRMCSLFPPEMSQRVCINKLKGIAALLFTGEDRDNTLIKNSDNMTEFLEETIALWKERWKLQQPE